MKKTLQFVLIGACALSIHSTFVVAEDTTGSTNGDPVSVVGISLMWLMVIMTFSGLVGGAINCLISSKDEDAGGPKWLKSTVLGIGASFLMPLFLNTISSTLVPNILDGEGDSGDVFVFAGFCLLAAISSRAFIETLADKVLREAKEATHQARETRKEVSEEIKFMHIQAEAYRLTEEGFREGQKGKIDLEIAKYSEALALDPKNSRARTNLAVTLGGQQPKDKELQMQQIQVLSNVIEDDPGFENAYYNRAAHKARVIVLATESGSTAPYRNEEVLADIAKSLERSLAAKLYARDDEDFSRLASNDDEFDKAFKRLIGAS